MVDEKLLDPSFIKDKMDDYLDKGFLWWKKGKKLLNSGEKYRGVMAAERLAAGLNNITYSLRIHYKTKQKDIGDREYILRIVDNKNFHKVENEVERMKQANTLDIPIPYLYTFEDDHSFLGSPFMIMQKIHGKPVMDNIQHFSKPQTKFFLAELAKCLGTLHTIRTDDWDSYYLTKKQLRERLGRKPKFSDYIMYEIKQILGGFKRLKLADKHNLDIQYLVKWFKGHAPLLKIDAYSLVHGDVRPSNIMVKENANNGVLNLSGLIDWEMSCYSDPAQDLGWTLFFFKLYDNLRSERGYFFQEYWKYCKKYNFEARVDFYETLAAIKLYTYAMSTKNSNPEKFLRNKVFFDKVINEVPRYIDRLMHRD